MEIEHLTAPTDADLDALTALWEASVRATHHFLVPDEPGLYRPLVRHEALPAADLYLVRRPDGRPAAFLGLDGEKIEMLFVAPDRLRQGLGRQLIRHAVMRCGARQVDVNEENAAARAFYARMGFRIVARDAKDPSGHNHPILHLALEE